MQKTMTIYFKDGRQPLRNIPLSESNKNQYEKVLGDVIKEFKADVIDITHLQHTKPTTTAPYKQIESGKVEIKTVEAPITDESLIKHLSKMGKSPLSISKIVGKSKDEIETILNK